MQNADMSNDGNSALTRFFTGINFRAYAFLGVHETERKNVPCTICRVWAPNAKTVSVAGDFNGWKPGENPMAPIGGGVWECFLPRLLKPLESYKFCVEKRSGGRLFKSDPYAFYYDGENGGKSKYYKIGYRWNDAPWMRRRAVKRRKEQPFNIYKVHPGFLRRDSDGNAFSYEKFAEELVPYVKDMGYTHVELTPIMEYPYDASCGFGTTGYFAPTSRYGEPLEFMNFIEKCHEANVGVILDWMPGCFPNDEYGLARFDGTPCYEYANPMRGAREEQGALVFDYGKSEVVSFLISSAVFWLEQYHADGLRLGDIASMLYPGRDKEDCPPDRNDGNANLEAVAFLQKLNETVSRMFPSALMIAEESSSWPMVSRPVCFGGLGFDYKMDMDWMHGAARYMTLEPVYRKYNHDSITFSFFNNFAENPVLPFPHGLDAREEVSLTGRMPGDDGQKLAGARALMCYMVAHPGKKLVFMGTELGLCGAWNWEKELGWSFLKEERCRKQRLFFKDLNHFYLNTPALWELDFSRDGFQWISNEDCTRSVIAFRRIGKNGREIIAVCNFLPEIRKDYRIGVPFSGVYAEIFSSDRIEYGGSGITNGSGIVSDHAEADGFEQSVGLTLPPLSVVFLRCRRRGSGPKRKNFPVE